MTADEQIQTLTRRVEDAERSLVLSQTRFAEVERKADRAVQTALGAVETLKHQLRAAEAAHVERGEMLATVRKLVLMVEVLVGQSVGSDPPPG